MIAAPDPQEFIPSGRQLAVHHPGSFQKLPDSEVVNVPEFLSDEFEKVTINESKRNERWIIRSLSEINNTLISEAHSKIITNLTKSRNSELFADDSWLFKSTDSNVFEKSRKRCSNYSTTKANEKRFSTSILNKSIQNEVSLLQASETGSKADTSKSNTKLNYKSNLRCMEEELYIKDNCVIWTRGLVSTGNSCDLSSRIIKKSFSLPSLVKQALWCDFYCEHPVFSDSLEGDKPDVPLGEPISCICIIDNESIYTFTEDNEDFITSVPFNVKKMWVTKFGLLLEKATKDKDNSADDNFLLPSLFLLTHPLDEFSPIAIKHTALKILDDDKHVVVFTSKDPSLCFLYDEHTGQHSIYLIRRIRANENVEISVKAMSKAPSLGLSDRLRSRLSFLGDHEQKRSFSQGTPFSSRAASVTSVPSSRSQSSMATISRCQSPAMSPLVSGGPLLTKLFRQSLIRNAEMYSSYPTEGTNFEPSEAPYQYNPTLCLDLLWTDSISSQQNSEPATKAFFCNDFSGCQFFCYLLPSSAQLIIVEMTTSNKNQYKFTYLSTMSAKDAVSIPHLHLMAVLDHSSNITLCSGLNLVGKLHIGGVLVQHSPSPLIMRNILHFSSPFPRRSTLLPHYSTPVADPNFEEHLLSPVLPVTPSSNKCNAIMLTPDVSGTAARNNRKVQLTELRDAVNSQLTLQYSDGTYYRVTLPAISSSSLINTCLIALRETLKLPVMVFLTSKWYTIRNAPGCNNNTQEKEWSLFTSLMFDLLGYNVDVEGNINTHNTPSSAPKRQRTCSKGSDMDWNAILETDLHKRVDNRLSCTLNLKKSTTVSDLQDKDGHLHCNTNATLFPYIFTIYYTLHLVYEELKLNSLRHNELPLLASFLNKLACDIELCQHAVYYWKDFPNHCVIRNKKGSPFPSNCLGLLENRELISEVPESIFQFIYDLLQDKDIAPFPYIPNVNIKTKNIVQLCGLLIKGSRNPNSEIELGHFVRQVISFKSGKETFAVIKVENDAAKRVVVLMTDMGITNKELDTFPAGINLLLHDALWQCRENPPSDWNAKAYNLLQRPDLASQAQITEKNNKADSPINTYGACGPLQEILPIKEVENEDGMEDINNALLKLRFPEDHRVTEARRLLQSSKPVPIVLVQRPDMSDHDFIDEQEKHLYAICSRTMALPVGRGMFTLRTATPIITEPLACPRLCLTGKAPPCGATVELTHIDTPPNMSLWPLFHNGVANGLRISPDAHNIDSNWIVFNKPKNSVETVMEHAGFLMALGLNGHLKNLAIMKTFDYLSKFHEMTSVGVLLGMAAAARSTADSSITKMLSIHVEALLPPTSMELDIPQNLQVAALMGIGLVYQGTGHRHMTEVLLSEIGRPPGPEMDNSVDRESYSLTAGLALGLVTLRQAGKSTGLTDLNIPDTLHYYMVGGNKRPLTGAQRDKYKVSSFQIKEGTTVNLDITAPAATLALGLMFLGSGNKAVADWMAPPATQYLLDFVRPDFLMLRVLARSLILWDEIVPDKQWIESQVPSTVRCYCMVQPSSDGYGIDYEAMNQAYCNIVAGACFALGLKYAGFANEKAYKTLLHYCHMFISLMSKSIAELAGKPTIETCLNIVLISAAMVMAGTGDLEIMRIVRHLRRRVGVTGSSVVTYGSHLAVHMALGLLFLGGGRYTLSNSPSSIAALICAFYPKFPTHSNDNRYHLQAFRHLYVLAVEPRLAIPKDISTGKMCYAWLKLVYLDGTSKRVKGPCLLPDLNTLSRVCVDDERYWPIVFERERNWDLLLKLMSITGFIEVKQRAGCLSYLEDKSGYRSQLARTLTQSSTIPWDPPPKSIISFSSDSTVQHFAKLFLVSKTTDRSEEEMKFSQILTRATYDFVIRDKLSALPILISLVKAIQDLDSVLQLWQFRLVCCQILRQSCASNLISRDTCLVLMEQIALKISGWEPALLNYLRSYVSGENFVCSQEIVKKMAAYVTYYDIPFNLNIVGNNCLDILCHLNNSQVSAEAAEKLLRIFNVSL